MIVTDMKTVLCYNSDDGELLWRDSGMLGRMDDSFELKGHFKIEYEVNYIDSKSFTGRFKTMPST